MDRMVVLALMAMAFPYAATHPVGEAGPGLVPDSIQADLASGRYWKASRELRDIWGTLDEVVLEDRLVLAGAEAGWYNWPGVLDALTGVEPSDTPAPEYWFLLGQARQELGDEAGADEAFRRLLDVANPATHSALIARSWIVRNQGSAAEPAFLSDLEALRAASPVVSDWTAVELARTLSEAGRPEDVRAALDRIIDPAARRPEWRLEAEAWAALGDSARALSVLEELASLEGDDAPDRRGLLSLLWRFRLSQGDESGASAAISELLTETTGGPAARRAASTLLDRDLEVEPEIYLRAGTALLAGGEHGLSLAAWRRAESEGVELGERDRLSRARALAGAGRTNDAIREYRALSESESVSISAPSLREWSRIRRRQGRRGDAAILEDRLIERYPERSEAVAVVFSRGDALQDAGRLDEAIERYQQLIGMSPAANQAGLARMRWAQIHLARSQWAAAADVFEGYLEDFPDGRRWEEAAYWGAWARTRLDDAEGASRLAERVLEGNPFSYYAVLAAELESRSLPWDFEDGGTLPDPRWLSDELEVLHVLEGARLAEGADAHVEALKAVAWESPDVLLKLALELNDRGRTMDGINLGWELRRRGQEWDLRLLRAVYPFPFRELVTSFAEERQLDPYLLAGIIRQESAFVPEIVSHAGAIGLMQVIPATGRQLARAIGPRSFDAEALKTPEVNVHLGTRFLSDLLRRYDHDLPLVLSAYNAGPGRADRWKGFPEVRDPQRFTERIPFAETRGYVKNVTRNRAVYGWLYGPSDASRRGPD